MIYRNSTDPVFIKKIKLKVWSLRDEIEAVIRKRLESNGDELTIDDIVQEYRQNVPKLTLVKNEEQPQNTTEEEEKEEKETEQEDSDSLNESEQKTGHEVITQRTPSISPEKIACGKTILTEIYMNQIFFFSEKPFVEGQSIVIEFCIPQHFVANADIKYCQAYSCKNRIISDKRLPYRICAHFSFLKRGERTLLRQFISSIEFEENRPKNVKETQELQEASEEAITEEMFNSADEDSESEL